MNSSFTILSQKACLLGKVTDEFEVNVKKREDNFPTGIQLEDFAVAIPHTDAEYVKEEFIAVAVFKEPVKFSSASMLLSFTNCSTLPHTTVDGHIPGQGKNGKDY